MAKVERILIVGGGIAGLAVATALHRHDFAPEIVERSPAWPAVGAGIALHANGVRVLRALGLGEAIDRAAAVLPRWGFFDQHGELLCETNLEDFWTEVGPCLGITRVRLQEILLTGAAVVPHRLGMAVTSVTQKDNWVSVGFSDGSSGDFDLVVGADGIYWTTRKHTIGSVSPSYAGQMAWRSVVLIRPRGLTDLMILLGESCFFGLVPVGDGQTYGFGGVDVKRFVDPLEGRLERFRRRFAAFDGPVPEYLAALERDDQLHVGPIEWMELEQWHSGRVVLIGGAAHAAPPHMGEGGSMALEDAVVLAEILHSADTVGSVLDLYVARRRPRAEWVQEQSRIAAQAWVLSPAVRNAALRERGDEMFRDRYRPLIPVA